jgi:hypothetical protein
LCDADKDVVVHDGNVPEPQQRRTAGSNAERTDCVGRLGTKLANPEDRTVATILWLVGVSTIVALAIVPNAAARDTVLKAAGGTVVLLGSYFAARTLKQTRADQRATRILKAIEMVGDDLPAVRVGAMWTLLEIASSSEGRRERSQVEAILAVLSAVPDDFDENASYKDAVTAIRLRANNLRSAAKLS